MNPHDKKNLDFIVSISRNQSAMEEWYMSISDDDKLYVQELVAYAVIESIIDEPLEYADVDCSEAKQYLTKFTLQGK